MCIALEANSKLLRVSAACDAHGPTQTSLSNMRACNLGTLEVEEMCLLQKFPQLFWTGGDWGGGGLGIGPGLFPGIRVVRDCHRETLL